MHYQVLQLCSLAMCIKSITFYHGCTLLAFIQSIHCYAMSHSPYCYWLVCVEASSVQMQLICIHRVFITSRKAPKPYKISFSVEISHFQYILSIFCSKIIICRSISVQLHCAMYCISKAHL